MQQVCASLIINSAPTCSDNVQHAVLFSPHPTQTCCVVSSPGASSKKLRRGMHARVHLRHGSYESHQFNKKGISVCHAQMSGGTINAYRIMEVDIVSKNERVKVGLYLCF